MWKIDQEWVIMEDYISRICQDGVKIRSKIKHQNYNLNVGHTYCENTTQIYVKKVYNVTHCVGACYHRPDIV